MPLQPFGVLAPIPASCLSLQNCQPFRRLGSYLLRPHSRVAIVALLLLPLIAMPLSAATLLKTITVGTTPGQVVVNPSAHLAYVVNQGSNNVSVIDTQLLKVKATLPVGSAPIGIAANPASGKAFVATAVPAQSRSSVEPRFRLRGLSAVRPPPWSLTPSATSFT